MKTLKNKEIVDRILAYHPTLIHYEGCDGYKCGNPEDECTGVAVALVPTADVILRAGQAGCNLIVTHEPLFYQTPDFSEWRGSFDNRVYEQKQELIQKYQMTIWRDHDHMHAHQPDAIFSGVIKELGWEDYFIPPKKGDPMCVFPFEMPETRIGDIAEHLKKTLHLNGLKYMGDLDKTVTRIALVGHLFPNSFMQDGIGEDGFYHDYAMEIMRSMEEQGIELIIPGEIIEWTVLSYIRDAVAMGKNLSCLCIGHFNLEELGMKDFTGVIRNLLQADTDAPKVEYLPTQDGFSYL
jgi:putative NIF3 family GTP cyclohydrolase 1 type 2